MIGLELVPAIPVAIAALLALVLPDRISYTFAGVVLAGISIWTLLVPAGTGPAVGFLGFDVILVEVDEITRLVGVVFAGFGTAAVGYGAITDADRRHLAVALGYAAAAFLAVFAGDWLGLLIGWEIMALLSTLLVWLHGRDAIRAGYRYALWHGLGGGLFAAGIAAHAIAGGGTTATALQFDGTGITPGLPTLLVGTAVAINAGVIGLHAWLPDTYPRPHVMASVFLCVYTTKTAVYAAYRVFPEGNFVLAYVGGVMTIYGAGYALAQKDMRRLLSYHIQAQVGYMLAGIGIGSALGIAGGFAHLFNNVLYKGLLFMIAGAIVVRTGRNRLDEFGALGTASPVLLVVFLIAALSISAVPGFNGFVSKGMVIDASVAANRPVLRWLLIAGGVGTVMSFAKFGYYAFFEGEPVSVPKTVRGEWIVYGGIAAACVVFGLAYELLFGLLPARDAWGTDPYSTSHLLEGVAIVATGLVGFVLSKKILDRLHGGVDVDRVVDPLAFRGTRAVSRAIASVAAGANRTTADAGWWILGTVRDRGGRTIGDETADTVIYAAIDVVRAPRNRIVSALSPRLLERYHRHQQRTPFSETGFKLSVETSVLVLAFVLALVIALALYF
ncbi:NADH:ubiquinone oxidoreductase subunit 4 (chain M) [Halalkaliarchaeum sp. AArc-CO]|uniref:Na(+)/H(+) antiporter subunit D n=1 Tax=unclassified Halalkaliarchaeum TaxID=2678344 RepID=UPI00217CFCDE|nr:MULTISPECIES: Na(+)/H(+) antiporter subunit D [unclassified Halalkaliarchaeum]MDR5672448.1 Na(+)/H(+) antiporter subunit D [Halalkaliarchaeum sp. AArc-GB]UWG49923.1 NADH:ubiquinone oxidoreductase subunit 4 (chain M) [Halalkaliarchaeum sp. AArc-CO]